MKIKFLGAAGMVTGSNHLIEVNGIKLILDCGLFQGGQLEDDMNYEEFNYNPGEIDYLILSHAHIDHSGRIPKLVKEGFKGRIIMTKATAELTEVMLLDSANIQKNDTEWENKKRERVGKELIEPLYDADDVRLSQKYFEGFYYDQIIKLDEHISLVFRDAGHMLGSAIVELWIKDGDEVVHLVYSGDLGTKGRTIINDISYIDGCDYLIMESTYGDTVHPKLSESIEELIKTIDVTTKRGGTVVIPAFAVGRTQELIYELNRYYEDEKLEEYLKVPIYVDSPMGLKATEVYKQNSDLFNEETTEMIMSGDNPFEFSNLRYVDSVEESKMLNNSVFPKVIIASSGMADAGRVRHHLKHNLWNSKNTVLFVGYQAEGSTGRRILDGVKSIRIAGEEIKIAAEIKNLEGFSAHADQSLLYDWVAKMVRKPKRIFLVHGESNAQTELKSMIESGLDIPCSIPNMGEEVQIVEKSEQVILSNYDLMNRAKGDLEGLLQSVDEKYSAFKSNMDKEEYDMKNYREYKDKLLELQNKLMELILISGK